MRIRALIVFAFVSVLSASPAAAIGTHQFGLEAGASVPSGNFGDAASMGFNVGGLYQYQIDRFGVGGEVKYHAWNASSDMKAAFEAANGAGSEIKFSAMQYDVYGTVNLPIASMPMLSPYAKLGVGWYAPSTKVTTSSGDTSDSNSDFGLMGGLGLEFNTHAKMKFGIDADYHRVKDSETDFISVSARALFPLH